MEFPMEHDDSHEDYITWLKILKKYGPAVGIDRPYLKYRLSEGGKSRNKLKSASDDLPCVPLCWVWTCEKHLLFYFLCFARPMEIQKKIR